MRVAWWLSRDAARNRLGSLAGLALVIAVVTAVVLAGAAGARRTAGVLDRFLDATDARDVGALALSPELTADEPRTEQLRDAVASIEGVERVTRGFGYFVVPSGGGTADFILTSSPDGHYEAVDRPTVLRGRMPDRDAPDEVALNATAAEALGLDVGDTLTVATYAPQTIVDMFEGTSDAEGPDGPTLDLDVVGVVRTGEELSATVDIANALGITSPAFAEVHEHDVGRSVLTLGIAADPATDAAAVQQVLADHVGERWESIAGPIEDDYVGEVSRAHHTLAVGVAVFSLVAAAAGLLAIGQALARQNLLRSGADQVARGLGATRRERALAVSLPTWFAIGAGVLAGGLASIALSPLFPLSIARRAETEPGVRVDPLVLGIGMITVAAVCLAWTLLSARRIVARSTTTSEVRSRRPRLASTVARWGLPPSTVVGLRTVADPGRGSTAVPARSAVLGAAVAVTGIVAIATFAASVHAAESDPARYGWAWSSQPDVLTEDPEATAAAVAADPDVADLGVLQGAPLQIGSEVAYTYALDVRSGSMAFTLLDGTLPTGSHEIALGRRTLDALGLEVGDRVEVAPPTGEGDEVTIVGVVVPPLVDGTDPGKGAVMTVDGLEAIRPEAASRYLVLTYEDGSDQAALESRLAQDHGLSFTSSSGSAPGQVQQLDGMRDVMVALTVFLAAVGVIGLIHFLAVSVRRRRRQYAVLRALGFVGAQVRRSVVWQATIATGVGVVIGIPAGVIIGRTTWLLAVREVAMVDDPATPWVAMAVVVLAVIAGAAVLALGPGWYAARGRPAAVLRAE